MKEEDLETLADTIHKFDPQLGSKYLALIYCYKNKLLSNDDTDFIFEMLKNARERALSSFRAQRELCLQEIEQQANNVTDEQPEAPEKLQAVS